MIWGLPLILTVQGTWGGVGWAALRVLGRKYLKGAKPAGVGEGLLALALSFQGSRAPSSLLTSELYGSRRQPGRQFVVKMTKFTLGTVKGEGEAIS